MTGHSKRKRIRHLLRPGCPRLRVWLAVREGHRFELCLAAAQARPTMTKSVVLDSVTGESQDSEVRTSTGTFFNLNVRPCRLVLPSFPECCQNWQRLFLNIWHACVCGVFCLCSLQLCARATVHNQGSCDLTRPGHAGQVGVCSAQQSEDIGWQRENLFL